MLNTSIQMTINALKKNEVHVSSFEKYNYVGGKLKGGGGQTKKFQ